MIVDVPSHHHISLLVADLNARSAIILAIMLTSARFTIVYMDSEATHHLTVDMVNLAVH